MKKIYTLIQQGLVAMVIAGASIGVVLAAPSFDVTTLVDGFIRTRVFKDAAHGDKLFFYGYGWSGRDQAWGYGYGYDSSGFEGGHAIANASLYGFEGTEGPAVVTNIETEQTSATITYSTGYLARMVTGYSLSTDPQDAEILGIQEEHEFNSGTRIWGIDGLTCGTTYGFGLIANDVGDNPWRYWGTFTTQDCPSDGKGKKLVISGSVVNDQPVKVMEKTPLTLRIPAIFLSFGSNGTDVQDLQRLLNFFGTLLASHGAGAPGEETIYFRNKTLDALKRFQAAFHLTKVDGIYGPETQRAMYEQLVK